MMLQQLCHNLQDALRHKEKSLGLQCEIELEVKRRKHAEDALREERLTSKCLKDQVNYYKKCLTSTLKYRNVDVESQDAGKNVTNILCDKIAKAFGVRKGTHAETRVAKLLELISTGLLFDGAGVSILESLHQDYVRKRFSPWKLVYASDMSPAGSFCTATVTGLTEFFDEPDDIDDCPKSRMFPPASAVSSERLALNKYALETIGLTRRETAYGEIYYVNPETAIHLLLDAAGLTELAQRGPVKIAVTSDGANSFHNRTQISIGVKIVDTRGVHCKTKKPIFVAALDDDTDDDNGHYQRIQSSEMCAILVMADARDILQMYQEIFSEFYTYMEGLR